MKPELISAATHLPTFRHSGNKAREPRRHYALFLAVALAVAVFPAPVAQGQTLTTIYGFTGENDAWYPENTVIYANGILYGTTPYGNNTTGCNVGHGPSNGCGTVYQVSLSGTETLLHVFTGNPDGQEPRGGLVQDPAGNFYGTTFVGGTDTSGVCGLFGCGTVYKIDTTGHETVLYSFTKPPDGNAPIGNLVIDAKGNLYGVTQGGGTFDLGTIFKLDTTGHETILHNFAGPPADGESPEAGLVRDAKGTLYGTTNYGGNAPNIGGTVFKLDASGHETVLYNFTNEGDGYRPESTLVMDSKGNLYGTALYGGYANQAGFGTVFRVSAAGKFSVLHRFQGAADGSNPAAGLLRSVDGKSLYGTTSGMGDAVYPGTVFQVSASGETVLFNFPESGVDGWSSFAGLAQDSAGNLYGTTLYGGPGWLNGGTVFKLVP